MILLQCDDTHAVDTAEDLVMAQGDIISKPFVAAVQTTLMHSPSTSSCSIYQLLTAAIYWSPCTRYLFHIAGCSWMTYAVRVAVGLRLGAIAYFVNHTKVDLEATRGLACRCSARRLPRHHNLNDRACMASAWSYQHPRS